MKARYFAIACTLALILAVGTAQGTPLTGHPESDGWTFQGHSMEQGVYVRSNSGHATNYGFDIYTTAFTVTDSAVFSFAGHDEAHYAAYYEDADWSFSSAQAWNAGDSVIGIGGVFRTVTATEVGWDTFTGDVASVPSNENRIRFQAKIGTEGATWTPSTVAPAAGDGAGSTGQGGEGRLFVRNSGWLDLDVWEALSGEVMGIQKESHMYLYNTDGRYSLAEAARLVWDWDPDSNALQSWQILVNTTLLNGIMESDYVYEMAIGSVQVNNAAYTDGLVTFDSPSNEIIPEPATMTLLGLGLAGLAAKRLRRKRS